jgi:hypothetical protein
MLDYVHTDTRHGRFEVSDIPLEGGAVLRVGLEYDRHSRPIVFHMAVGIGTGREWSECPDAGFGMPPDRIGALIRALLPFLDRVR